MSQKLDSRKDNLAEKHHLIRKFGCAFRGIGEAIRIDNSFKYHFVAGIVAAVIGFVLRIGETEWIAIIIVISMVLVAEMFNTVCEIMTRMYTNQYHELVKKMLDISAGAVLFASIAAFAVGIIILGKHIDRLSQLFTSN